MANFTFGKEWEWSESLLYAAIVVNSGKKTCQDKNPYDAEYVGESKKTAKKSLNGFFRENAL